MKPVLRLFVMPSCPYCKQVLNWMEELRAEDPRYEGVELTTINEKLQPDVANQYDYYYVPTYFIDQTKVHEGAASKEKVRKVFDQYLAQK